MNHFVLNHPRHDDLPCCNRGNLLQSTRGAEDSFFSHTYAKKKLKKIRRQSEIVRGCRGEQELSNGVQKVQFGYLMHEF